MLRLRTSDGPALDTLDAETRRRRLSLVRDYSTLAVLAGLFAVLAATADGFFSITNLVNVAEQNAALGIVACGATFVIISGGFDLSVGAIFAVAGVLAAWLVVNAGVVLGVAGGLCAGVLLGIANGVLVGHLGINSFLATLASGLMMGGIALAITDGFLIDVTMHPRFVALGQERLAGVPHTAIAFGVTLIVLGAVLAWTKFGRHVYAVGGNPEAARLSGISVVRVRIAVFALSGLAAALAGVLETAKNATGQADVGGTLPLDAIAAIVIGGTSILGGRGAMWRTLVGVMLLALIHNGFNLLSVAPYVQNLFIGGIILLAVMGNALAGQR